jgi:hypothetical protein
MASTTENLFLELELANLPYFQSGKQPETPKLILMRHRNGLKSITIDEFLLCRRCPGIIQVS